MLRVSLVLLFACFFICGCNHVFYYPDSKDRLNPNKLKLEYSKVSITTSDNQSLSAWHVFAKNKQPIATVLHFHGNAENISSHFLYVAWLAHFGFDVIAFDYRGYGSSTGVPTREGLYFDSLAALNFAQTHARTQDVFVLAQSLGGAVAVPGLAQTPSVQKVRALVLDSTFASYRMIARAKLDDIFFTWPLQWPLSFLVSDDYSAIDYIQKISIPIVFVHGEQDEVVPYETGYKLYETYHGKKELWNVEWGGHASAFVNFDDKFRKKLVYFYCSNLTHKNPICDSFIKKFEEKKLTKIPLYPEN